MMRKVLVGGAIGVVTYWALGKFAVKREDGSGGFIQVSDGFGMDDVFLGGLPAIAAIWIGAML